MVHMTEKIVESALMPNENIYYTRHLSMNSFPVSNQKLTSIPEHTGDMWSSPAAVHVHCHIDYYLGK